MTKKLKELIEDDIMLLIAGAVTVAFYVGGMLS